MPQEAVVATLSRLGAPTCRRLPGRECERTGCHPAPVVSPDEAGRHRACAPQHLPVAGRAAVRSPTTSSGPAVGRRPRRSRRSLGRRAVWIRGRQRLATRDRPPSARAGTHDIRVRPSLRHSAAHAADGPRCTHHRPRGDARPPRTRARPRGARSRVRRRATAPPHVHLRVGRVPRPVRPPRSPRCRFDATAHRRGRSTPSGPVRRSRSRPAASSSRTDSLTYVREYPLVWNGRRYLYDFAFPNTNTILETNGRRWHDDPSSYERDHEKWSVPGRLGFRIVFATWDKVVHNPLALVHELRTTMTASRSEHPQPLRSV